MLSLVFKKFPLQNAKKRDRIKEEAKFLSRITEKQK